MGSRYFHSAWKLVEYTSLGLNMTSTVIHNRAGTLGNLPGSRYRHHVFPASYAGIDCLYNILGYQVLEWDCWTVYAAEVRQTQVS